MSDFQFNYPNAAKEIRNIFNYNYRGAPRIRDLSWSDQQDILSSLFKDMLSYDVLGDFLYDQKYFANEIAEIILATPSESNPFQTFKKKIISSLLDAYENEIDEYFEFLQDEYLAIKDEEHGIIRKPINYYDEYGVSPKDFF